MTELRSDVRVWSTTVLSRRDSSWRVRNPDIDTVFLVRAFVDKLKEVKDSDDV